MVHPYDEQRYREMMRRAKEEHDRNPVVKYILPAFTIVGIGIGALISRHPEYIRPQQPTQLQQNLRQEYPTITEPTTAARFSIKKVRIDGTEYHCTPQGENYVCTPANNHEKISLEGRVRTQR